MVASPFAWLDHMRQALALVDETGASVHVSPELRRALGDAPLEPSPAFIRSALRGSSPVPGVLVVGDVRHRIRGHRFPAEGQTLVLVRLLPEAAEFRRLTERLDLQARFDARQRLATNELAALRVRLAAIIDHLPSAVSIKAADGTIQVVNREYARLVGRPRREIIGRKEEEITESGRFKAPDALAWSGDDGEAQEQVWIDGVEHTFMTRRFVMEDPVTAATSIGWIRTDITELIEAGRRQREVEQNLLHTQKLESLGVLAGGIAHDFNNLLMGILGNSEMASALIRSEPSVAVSCLQDIESASHKAAELCRQLLGYAGKGRFVMEPIDLSALVTDMVPLIEVSLHSKTRIKLELDEVPCCRADESQMQQVVMNLVTNASESLRGAPGDVVIRIGARHFDRSDLDALDVSVRAGPYVFAEVSDTGCGMSSDVLRRMFEPFYTTKFTGRGLGLAAVRGIVAGHEGALSVRSEENRGTTVTLLVPTTDERPAVATVSNVAPRHEGCVLVVDDDTVVRRTARRILKRAGYEVVEAEDGVDAIEIVRENPQRFCAVLLDMTMPRMGGAEAYQRIREISPEMPVVLSSGYNDQEATNLIVGQRGALFLQKPYPATELLSSIWNARQG